MKLFDVSDRRNAPLTPGRALKIIAAGHAGWGVLAYGDRLVDLARSGFVGSVGDGVFDREHCADGRAAAFWFMITAPLMALCGHLLDGQGARQRPHAERVAGATVLGIGTAGAAAMPRSGFWSAIAVGAWLLARSRR